MILIIFSLIVLGLSLFCAFIAWLDAGEDMGFALAMIGKLIAFILLLTGLLSMAPTSRYDITCNDVVYKDATANLEGHYLVIKSNGETFYEKGPCDWVNVRNN